jgi:hypothetical protein
MNMKKTRMTLLGLAVAATALFSFHKHGTTVLKGKVTPAFYAVNAWAISGHDTLYTSVDDGNFAFSINDPGTYKIIIEARSPYRHIAKDGIVVKEGQPTDIGELSLQKWE